MNLLSKLREHQLLSRFTPTEQQVLSCYTYLENPRPRQNLGHCDYQKKEISVNGQCLIAGNKAIYLDTLLHECAHALSYHVYGQPGHGPTWHRVASRLGANPRACQRVVNSPDVQRMLNAGYKMSVIIAMSSAR